MKSFTVKKSDSPIAIDAGWDSDIWSAANTAKVDFGFDRNSDHIPEVHVKMLHDGNHIFGLFQVKDRYVIARADADQQQVCRDSCVEFFIKPSGAGCYFNFEFNCGGTLLLYRCVDIFNKDFIEIPQEDLDTVRRFHTLPHIITEEISDPVTWYLGFAIPVDIFRKYAGFTGDLSGQSWRGNFTKCADKCSHPTWLSWTELSECSFHLHNEFEEIIFE